MIRRGLFILLPLALLAGVFGMFLLVHQRQADCAYIPVIGDELLPNAALVPAEGSNMPLGWERAADGVELRGSAISDDPNKQGFDLDGDGRALQLIGIANEVRTPQIAISPNQRYCFLGRALTDSDKQSTTRLRAVFDWRNAQGETIAEQASAWQPVALWASDLAEWSAVRAAFRAPDGAAMLQVRLQPASDDRVYLDGMHVRRGGRESAEETLVQRVPADVQLMPWPKGAGAAISFSFDWETAMGGLIHSRSVDDPNADQDWAMRAMRMRDGVTTTLEIFRPYGVRATYYATGYNFLQGNTERREFMGNPTYPWANQKNHWSDTWKTTPWFSADPYGTVASDPGWYFGDLIPKLQAEKQNIQSHTFAHFAGTFARKADWQADLDAWHEVAAERGVAPARSLAFPWSSSNGMSDDDWRVLAENGITSVTRTSWSQRQYSMFPYDAKRMPIEPRCRPVPAHDTILACPDFYLTEQSAPDAPDMIDRAIAAEGMIDLWAHTEEVISPAQIVAWTNVVRYAAEKRDAGETWIAPLSEIADWQQGLQNIVVEEEKIDINDGAAQPVRLIIRNENTYAMDGLAVKLPFSIARVEGNVQLDNTSLIIVPSLAAGQQLEVTAWPA